MAKRYVVIDHPPLEAAQTPWAASLAKAANLTLVDNAKVTEALSKDKDAQKAFLGQDMKKPVDPLREQEKTAPYYRKALETLHGKDDRLLLWGNAWVNYVPVDAFILDWSEVEKRAAAAPKDDKGSGAFFKQTAKNFVAGRIKKAALSGSKILELPLKLSEADRLAKSVAFLKTLGV